MCTLTCGQRSKGNNTYSVCIVFVCRSGNYQWINERRAGQEKETPTNPALVRQKSGRVAVGRCRRYVTREAKAVVGLKDPNHPATISSTTRQRLCRG